MDELLKDPDEGCFLCAPEKWRVIFSGRYNRVIVGVGPLTNGYCMISPKEHISTVANLSQKAFFEFISLSYILKLAYKYHYRNGSTSYEHARIGVCSFEVRESCQHAHRVFIPTKSDVFDRISDFFEESHFLEKDIDIQNFSQNDYVYYEVDDGHKGKAMSVFLNPKEPLFSQFMRRILSEELEVSENWNWAIDHDYKSMISTIKTLCCEFSGISLRPEKYWEGTPKLHLNNNIFLDGLTCVGKSTIASIMSSIFGVKVIETGYLFRFIAYYEINHGKIPSPFSLTQLLVGETERPNLNTIEIYKKANEIAEDVNKRDLYKKILIQLVGEKENFIFVGRDTWKYSSKTDCKFLIISDFSTRVKRKMLDFAYGGTIQTIEDIKNILINHDNNDYKKLPLKKDCRGVIENSRSDISLTIQDILTYIGTQI